jgi:hypothetical protein
VDGLNAISGERQRSRRMHVLDPGSARRSRAGALAQVRRFTFVTSAPYAARWESQREDGLIEIAAYRGASSGRGMAARAAPIESES